MIEYEKLFALLKERKMKKTDLLKIMSSQTLSKLSKNATIQSDIIDKICLYLEVQPNDIMEVYEYAEINGNKIKIKKQSPDTKHITDNELRAPILSELSRYIIEKDGKTIIDTEKLKEEIEKIKN